jgi:hypothetical protein
LIFAASAGSRQEQVDGQEATAGDSVAASTGTAASDIRRRRQLKDRTVCFFTRHTTHI